MRHGCWSFRSGKGLECLFYHLLTQVGGKYLHLNSPKRVLGIEGINELACIVDNIDLGGTGILQMIGPITKVTK